MNTTKNNKDIFDKLHEYQNNLKFLKLRKWICRTFGKDKITFFPHIIKLKYGYEDGICYSQCRFCGECSMAS